MFQNEIIDSQKHMIVPITKARLKVNNKPYKNKISIGIGVSIRIFPSYVYTKSIPLK